MSLPYDWTIYDRIYYMNLWKLRSFGWWLVSFHQKNIISVILYKFSVISFPQSATDWRVWLYIQRGKAKLKKIYKDHMNYE